MDKKSLKILKMFYYHKFLSCDMISAVLECDVNSVMEICLFLRNRSYISTSDITQINENEIYPDSPYRITIQGKTAYEYVLRDNRSFLIPVAISIIAVIISIIALLKP